MIETALRKVADTKGYEVVNYGMYGADDAAQLTYVQNGILAAVLLNSGAADFVVTGCGTGEGAFAGEHFDEYFFRDCKDPAIAELVKKLK